MADKVKYSAEVDLAGGVTTTTVTASGEAVMRQEQELLAVQEPCVMFLHLEPEM